MKDWEALLAYREITASYRGVQALQNYFFTQSFYQSPRAIWGDTVEMVEVSATNSPGPMNTRGAAARVIQPKGGAKREFSLFHYFTELPIDPTTLMMLRSMDSEQLQSMGKEVLDLQLEESSIRHRLAKEVIMSMIFCYNRVNISASSGNILVPSVHATTGAITDASGATISADFGVPDDHRGNLGGIISAQWSTAGTDIAVQLDNIDRQAAIDGAPAPMDYYVNGLHKNSFANNTQVKEFAKYNNINGLGQQVLSNFDKDILTVFNKRFHFISGTWVDSTGTTRDIMPQNIALALPDKGAWLRPLTGRTLVPKNEVGIASPATPNEHFEPVEGEYGYAYSNHNPVRTSVFAGDTFGIGFANPNAIWVPKVFS